MSDDLTFMMGQFAATFPADRLYAKNHMWAKPQAEGVFRFGFTAYAVRLLQDVYFLEWVVDAPSPVKLKQQIGAIESKKAESELYAPLAGTLQHFNAALLADPSTINVDKYGEGWLFDLACTSDGLLTPAEYLEHLQAVWEVTQRTIKGQLNDD